jgi:alkanesulfonate monooxygenase SsuD/methylene tetrahydromethanopterin reductase-like flavin-dependent oxidoreductase (luciferase family)
MAVDIAARTKNIRIGLAAAIITFWHPLRLAEDLGLLDQLCDGRLELGLGRGNYGIEGTNLNPKADPRDPKQNFEVFAETLEILKKAFSQRLFSHQGKHYTVPAPGFKWDRAHPVNDADYIDPETRELKYMSVFPRPFQQPYPPLWQVVDSPLAIEFAAQNDLGIIMWRPPLEMLRERFRLYQETARKTTGKEVPFGARTGVVRDTFVADTMQQARELAERHVMRYLNWSNWRGPKIYLRPDEVLAPKQEDALVKELTYEFVKERSLLFGTPDYVADKIEELREELDMELLLINSTWLDFPQELAMRSMRLFAEKVLPRVRRGDRRAQVAVQQAVSAIAG